MPRVIILEGADACGKTTLAQELKKRLGADIWHEGVPPADKEPFQYYATKLNRALKNPRPVILDRFHLGQYVYAPMWRDDIRFTRASLMLFDGLMRDHDVMCVLCLPPIKVAREEYMKKLKAGDDYLNDFAAWVESYYRFMGLKALYPIFDWTRDSIDDLLGGKLENNRRKLFC